MFNMILSLSLSGAGGGERQRGWGKLEDSGIACLTAVLG